MLGECTLVRVGFNLFIFDQKEEPSKIALWGVKHRGVKHRGVERLRIHLCSTTETQLFLHFIIVGSLRTVSAAAVGTHTVPLLTPSLQPAFTMSTTPNPSPGRSSTGRGYQGRGGRGSGRGGRGGSPDRGAGRGRFQHATEQVVGANQSSNQSNQSVYSGPRTPNAPNPSGPNPSGPNGSASTPRKGSFSEFVKQKVLPKRGQRDKAPCAYQERTPPGAGRPPRSMPKCRNGDGCSNAKCQFIHSEFWDPNNASNVRKNPRPPRPSLKAAATAVVAARPSTTRGKTGVPVLNVDIDVGAEKKGTIVVKIGDDPLRLAVEFCR